MDECECSVTRGSPSTRDGVRAAAAARTRFGRRGTSMTGLVDRLFVGRAPELTRSRVALDEARAGHPQLVVVEGPGGIGKTTLLERFVAGENDLTVLRASGEQWEKALLPYGLLDQLVKVASTE